MSARAGTDPVIAIGADRNGAVVEADASQWPPGALAAALAHQLNDIAGPVSAWIDHPDHADHPKTVADATAISATVEISPTISPTISPGSAVPAETELGRALHRLGLTFVRDLYRMERSLPMDSPSSVKTRPFVVGQDEAAWVEVNNRAFSQHREQGGWTLEQVAERQLEPWFDPDGFRLHEIDGEIAAYCWTKVHNDENPPVGEVYVIAVDPSYHGRGLGRALTLAGYEHLAARGLTRAMLFVDADNTPALNLYLKLGLAITVVRRLFVGTGHRAVERRA